MESENRQRTFFLKTYGCQMNSRDSENTAAIMLGSGFLTAPSIEAADIVIFNTCCVRESAEDRFFGHLSRMKPLKEKKPELTVVVTGCMSQQEEVKMSIEKKHPYVDIVIGTGNRHMLPVFLHEVINQGKKIFDTSGLDEMPPDSAYSQTVRDFPHKAGINIMYGCDNFCSYCIVPYVRGRERSRAQRDIVEEVQNLVSDGVREIMLLGQNVNSYGKGQGGSFADLLYELSKIMGTGRIRFMTSHPRDFSPELILALRDLPMVCKHIHLPLQAGSTKVLKDMNRGYTKEEYLELVSKIKSQIPSVAITTDIIVGYPGETDLDFCDTLDVVKKAEFAGAFTFIYSKRSGTPAAGRNDTVPPGVVSKRFKELTDTLYPIMAGFNQKKVGGVFDCMAEEIHGDSIKGRLDDHSLVHFTSACTINPGDIVPVKITGAKTFYLIGAYNG